MGFHRAGFDCLWTAETNTFASDVLAKLGAPNLGDVREIEPDGLAVPDVVIWGSPCQDLSVANTKRQGLGGQKSSLFYEGIRIIESLRLRGIRFSIWENVAGALTANDGRDFHAVVQAFLDIGARDLAWRVLDGRYFGVAQTRRRVFVVADFGGTSAGEILCDAKASRLLSAESEINGVEVLDGGLHGALSARSPSRWCRPDNIITHWGLKTQRRGNEGSPGYMIAHGGVHATIQTRSDMAVRDHTWLADEGFLRWRTPLESDRLMGWPDNWTEYGASGKKMSDSARYMMTGNGVIAPLAYWLAVGVRSVLEEPK